jgi:hypothetical protein
MTANTRRQLRVLGVLVAIYSLLAAATYLIFPLDQLIRVRFKWVHFI